MNISVVPEVAATHNVTAMPTFLFFRNKVKLARLQGADPTALENKVRELIGNPSESEGNAEVTPAGHVDLWSFINKGGCECLNESDEHRFPNCLTNGSATYLESDCDEQLIMSIDFNQPVKLHSLVLNGPSSNGPKTLKLFINQPRTLDFDQADAMEPIQIVEVTSTDLAEGRNVPLRFVKFQNVQNLQVTKKKNQFSFNKTKILFNRFL